jgi:hypothetical protein
VRYATAVAFRTALEQRLRISARETDISLAQLRKLVAFDRLLARLVAVAPDRWVLKGALALHFRLGARFRATKDLDLGRWDGEGPATTDLLAVQSLDLGDYFQFAIEKTPKLDTLLDGAALRYHVSVSLAARPFEEVAVDVGFGAPPTTDMEHLRGPDLLGFADIEPSEVPALRIELHVAEKVHAYTRQYAGGRPNTRVKDLIDLVLIAAFVPLEAGRLRAALRTTFDSRGTHQLPPVVPPPPPHWDAAYTVMATEVNQDSELATGYKRAKEFLDPILSGTVRDGAKWDPSRQTW